MQPGVYVWWHIYIIAKRHAVLFCTTCAPSTLTSQFLLEHVIVNSVQICRIGSVSRLHQNRSNTIPKSDLESPEAAEEPYVMATFVLNQSTIRIVHARAIGRPLGSIDSTNRVRKLRLELTIFSGFYPES
ncbi:hypothetical protein PF005_g15514 [Phytophthora fragariae]|uniref:Uncharacterized protein n=1 Tax=Phytophthora fragariae TaxID=53985 RepID=A0A6A4D1V5_9STRA|nr:hypothetical protein PF003_g2584 [Phytophthora fragariae]KAE8933218.1 hypothetical protein PF009_g16770 [Phytophthora fragariae]KAE8999506.1 hypothetical protein PF011_g14601 [Phytophthora fragariae]KAE9071286.1 hypothetical protein PF010_g25927 [Phytophthora fragariae]KAE9102301.1 hypothetical protein PF007_g14819 [Phytophthora fragariae]